MMLRPDFTVPIVRLHMDAGTNGGAEPARYAYCGPVWRRQEWGSDRPREYLQAGLEIFAAGDPAAADAEVMALVVEALGDAPVDLVTGDLGLVLAAIDALDTTDARKAALRRHVWRPARFRALLAPLRRGPGRRHRRPRRPPRRGGRRPHPRPRRRRRQPPSACAPPRTSPPASPASPPRPRPRRSTPPPSPASRPSSPWRAARPRRSAALETLARRLPGLDARRRPHRHPPRRPRRQRHRPGAAALRGELRADLARILRRLRLRRPAARPRRPAADRQRRPLRRADPRPRARARASRPSAA